MSWVVEDKLNESTGKYLQTHRYSIVQRKIPFAEIYFYNDVNKIHTL